jgi:hypothetical protein
MALFESKFNLKQRYVTLIYKDCRFFAAYVSDIFAAYWQFLNGFQFCIRQGLFVKDITLDVILR